MSNSATNIVQKWASNILSDCQIAQNIIKSNKPPTDKLVEIQGYLGEIKGACEAILVTVQVAEAELREREVEEYNARLAGD